MIDGSEERKRQLAFELQNLCVFEERSKRLGGRLHEEKMLARLGSPSQQG